MTEQYALRPDLGGLVGESTGATTCAPITDHTAHFRQTRPTFLFTKYERFLWHTRLNYSHPSPRSATWLGRDSRERGECADTFSEATSAAAAAASATGSSNTLRAVPLIGRASRVPPRPPLKNLSGDEQHICSKTHAG